MTSFDVYVLLLYSIRHPACSPYLSSVEISLIGLYGVAVGDAVGVVSAIAIPMLVMISTITIIMLFSIDRIFTPFNFWQILLLVGLGL